MSVRSLGQLAIVLAILFATGIAGALFPLQPFNPLWQSRLIPALINYGTFPLIALALLRIATIFSPQDPLLKTRRILFEQIALVAAIGFLLLIPLQITSNLRLQMRNVTEQTQRIKEMDSRFAALRQAVDRATSSADLEARLRSLQFVEMSGTEFNKPLPQLRAEATAAFDRLQKQIAKQKANVPPANPLLLLPDLLRSSVALLALSTGYAAFGRRRHDDLSLLEMIMLRLQPKRRGQGRLTDSHQDYLDTLHSNQKE
jgi:hypothetical protein